jgi:hypothetical protein
MANKIVLKKSSVPAKVPLSTDLDYGEVAINYADGKLYYKKADNTIGAFSASGAGGVTFTTGTSAPASPQSGDEWLDTNSGIKYTYFNDGTSSQWVELESTLAISQSSSGSSSVYSNSYSLTGSTTNNTETELFVGGISNSRIPVPTNKTIYYTADVVCRRTDASGDHAAFYIKGVATNNSGVVSDVGLIYEVIIVRTDANFSVDFRADDTNNTINMYVTGSTGKTLSWSCALTILEV